MVLQERLGLKHVNVGDLIKELKCYEGFDEELNTNILDEDKLLDSMEVIFEKAAENSEGIVADYHACELFPERWFDLILVLRTKTEVLFDRLSARNYNDKKKSENMQAEIMQVVLDEAKESYAAEIVHEVPSNNIEDMDNNVSRVDQWMKQWLKDNSHC